MRNQADEQELDEQVRDVLLRAAYHHAKPVQVDDAARVLDAAAEVGRPVSVLATAELQRAVAHVYERGWQPLDLAHVVHVGLTRRAERLLGMVVRAEAAAGGGLEQAPQEWRDQLASLDADGPAHGGDPVGEWRVREPVDSRELWTDAVRLLGTLLGLPSITELIDPPSRWGGGGAPRVDETTVGDPKVLARVRALLAKAESTTFPAEAEALAAKAQELMTRYAVDAALLGDDDTGAVRRSVRARRVRLEDPYARPKAQLFFGIATANGVKAVTHPEHRLVSAVGLPTDLDLAELLFTSLLVQANRAMILLSDTDPASRGRSFRRGFLSAYAVRVGQRLVEARERAERDLAEQHGRSLVPVLARREEAVEETFEELFPHTRRMRSAPVDARGWRAGVEAADRADLGPAGGQARLTG